MHEVRIAVSSVSVVRKIKRVRWREEFLFSVVQFEYRLYAKRRYPITIAILLVKRSSTFVFSFQFPSIPAWEGMEWERIGNVIEFTHAMGYACNQTISPLLPLQHTHPPPHPQPP